MGWENETRLVFENKKRRSKGILNENLTSLISPHPLIFQVSSSFNELNIIRFLFSCQLLVSLGWQ